MCSPQSITITFRHVLFFFYKFVRCHFATSKYVNLLKLSFLGYSRPTDRFLTVFTCFDHIFVITDQNYLLSILNYSIL